MAGEKPRYPAKFFKKLQSYPRKNCLHCGKPLTPRIIVHSDGREQLQPLKSFEERKFCDNSCSARHQLPDRVKRLARGRREKAAKLKTASSYQPNTPTKPRRVQRQISLPSETKGAVRRALALDLLDPGDFLPADTIDTLHELREQGRRA